jgi:putative transposase
VDKSPAQVWATLLDEGTYLCSESTMYRILRSAGGVRERRRQATHPPRTRPELVATAPGQVWSWDITKLHGPARGVHYDLYVIIDIYSRYVPGWLVAPTETGELAKAFIAETIATAGTPPRVVHADRGTSMTSKPVALLLADLGVVRSHSRPKVSNDNPYSEAAFKTLKYCPAFPDRFGSIADARAFCEQFFTYYNHQHRHSGIGLHTPASVHHGTAGQIQALRADILADAHTRHPHRFRRPPQPPALPDAVWINRPALQAAAPQKN